MNKKDYVIKDMGFKNRYKIIYAENKSEALLLGSSHLGTCNCKIVKISPDSLVTVGMIEKKVIH